MQEEEIKDTKGVIRIRRKTEDTMAKKDKRTKNDLQNTTQKTKDRAKRTTPKIGGDIACSERKDSSCSTSNIRRLTLAKIPVISLEWGIRPLTLE
jgi:hypothetical protein